MTSAESLVALLRRCQLRPSTELALQQSIGEALTGAGIIFEPEYRLGPADRIDFLAMGTVGIEAKARYGKRAIYRQLERYAAHDLITDLVLVTGTALGLPPSINGKPVYIVSIGRAVL